MKLVRIGVTLRSPLGTPLKSDTLSGHLLCLFRERYGEEKLSNLLEDSKKGVLPFVISDAFPHDHLPVPVLKPMSRSSFKEFVESLHGGNTIEALKSLKRFRKKCQFIPLSNWEELSNTMSAKSLYFLHHHKLVLVESGGKAKITMHNTINRKSGRALEGALYNSTENWYKSNEEIPSLDIYARVAPSFETEFNELLNDLKSLGYGQDRSTGKGNLKFEEWEPMEHLDQKKGANAWMNLSTYSTTKGDEIEGGWYKMHTKFGKVWNGFGERNPFKKPLLVFEPGSVFLKQPENIETTVITGIHSGNPNIVQYCSPIMLPIKLQEAQ